MYITSCHVCQTFKNHKIFDRPMNRRIIDINAPTLTHISMDIKHMPPSKDKLPYILVMLCEASIFMVAAPMKTATAPEICNTIMDHFMGYFGTPYKNSRGISRSILKRCLIVNFSFNSTLAQLKNVCMQFPCFS